jgi:NADH-quinone oxidoreductase subunit N
MTPTDLYALLPALTLAAWACVLLIADLFIPKTRKGITALLAIIGLAAALGLDLMRNGQSASAFGGMLTLDGFSVLVSALLLVSGLFGVALAHGSLRRMGIERGEYYPLMLFSLSGMLLMAGAADLIVVFLALELLSIPLYILAAFAVPRAESEEAGLKYFLLGAFSTGFVVFGTALVYGATGATGLSAIFAAVRSGTPDLLLLSTGAALLLVGFGFKVALVPFHMWTPDVYQGAPTAVTGFMAAAAKIAGFAALLRVFALAFADPALSVKLTPILWALSALTMIAGNLVAIAQTNIKRMLAWSSIAHAGYVLMAFVPFANADVAPTSVAAALFYLFAYLLTSFGAWAVVLTLEQPGGRGLEILDYAGLRRKSPWLAAAMTVFMLSLTGLPPTLGLVGKVYLFRAVLDGGFSWLAVIGVLTSLISAFYYLRVVVAMYMSEGEPQVNHDPWIDFTWALAALATVVLSIFPNWLFILAAQAVLKF